MDECNLNLTIFYKLLTTLRLFCDAHKQAVVANITRNINIDSVGNAGSFVVSTAENMGGVSFCSSLAIPQIVMTVNL